MIELRKIAKECKLRNYSRLRKDDLISFLDCYCERGQFIVPSWFGGVWIYECFRKC
jgi:hypothetical protein